jgi:hypothetical protein
MILSFSIWLRLCREQVLPQPESLSLKSCCNQVKFAASLCHLLSAIRHLLFAICDWPLATGSEASLASWLFSLGRTVEGNRKEHKEHKDKVLLLMAMECRLIREVRT